MNQTHEMHFSIKSKKHVLDAKFEFMENIFLKGFTLSINPKVQILKNVYQGA